MSDSSIEVERQIGIVQINRADTGDQTNTAIYAILQFKDMAGAAAQTDTKAEWRVDKFVVTLSVTGTVKLTDGSADLTPAYGVVANTPFLFPGPIYGGRGKAIAYTTTGGGNPRLSIWASPMHYTARKATNFP